MSGGGQTPKDLGITGLNINNPLMATKKDKFFWQSILIHLTFLSIYSHYKSIQQKNR